MKARENRSRRSLTLFLMLGLLMACGSDDEPNSIDGGFRVVEQWTKSGNLDRSGFRSMYPEGRPSDLIEYLFSPMGAAEWPPKQGSGEFSAEEETMIARAGQPLIPSDISFYRVMPAEIAGKAIVLSADNDKGLIIAEAYADPTQPPVARKEFKLKR